MALLLALATGCGNECRYFEQCADDATLLQCGGGVDQVVGRKVSEVPCDADIMAVHDTIDNIEKDIREEMHCLAIIHMDPIDTRDELTNETKEKVRQLVKTIDGRLTIHDFRMVSGPTHTNVIFDVVVPFDLKMTDDEVKARIGMLVGTLGNYFSVVDVDKDINGDSEEP